MSSFYAKLQKRLAQEESGFTLIELLIVLVIIGILLAIAVPSYLGFKARAEQRAAAANVRSAVPAVEAFYADNGTYVGMNATALAAIDAGVQVTVGSSPSASSYCISNTQGNSTYRKVGPSGSIVSGVACT